MYSAGDVVAACHLFPLHLLCVVNFILARTVRVAWVPCPRGLRVSSALVGA